jgi:ketosteroid isomerase-like protein
MYRGAILAALLIVLCGSAGAQEARNATATVDDFHKALARNDTRGALSFLSRDLVVYEYGLIDPTLAQYAFKHLPLDMDAAAATAWTLQSRKAGGSGDVFWVLSAYRVTGYDKLGVAIDNTTLETVVLQRSGDALKIVHFHWSTTPAGAAPPVIAGTVAAPGGVPPGTR